MRDLEGLFEQREAYRDFDVRFMRNPVNGDIVTLNSIDSIKQSVRLLLMTSFYERPHQPKIGTRLRASLFELFDLNLESEIQKEIQTVIGKYEPRVTIKSIRVNSGIDQNQLNVHMHYLIHGRVQLVEQTINIQRVR